MGSLLGQYAGIPDPLMTGTSACERPIMSLLKEQLNTRVAGMLWRPKDMVSMRVAASGRLSSCETKSTTLAREIFLNSMCCSQSAFAFHHPFFYLAPEGGEETIP